MRLRILIGLAVTAASFCPRSEVQAGVPTPGTVISWGAPSFLWPYFQPGTRYQAIAAGEDFSLALLSDGTVIGWGDNANGQTTGAALGGGVAIPAGGGYQHGAPPRGAGAPRGDKQEGQNREAR